MKLRHLFVGAATAAILAGSSFGALADWGFTKAESESFGFAYASTQPDPHVIAVSGQENESLSNEGGTAGAYAASTAGGLAGDSEGGILGDSNIVAVYTSSEGASCVGDCSSSWELDVDHDSGGHGHH